MQKVWVTVPLTYILLCRMPVAQGVHFFDHESHFLNTASLLLSWPTNFVKIQPRLDLKKVHMSLLKITQLKNGNTMPFFHKSNNKATPDHTHGPQPGYILHKLLGSRAEFIRSWTWPSIPCCSPDVESSYPCSFSLILFIVFVVACEFLSLDESLPPSCKL